MTKSDIDYKLIETEEQMAHFYEENRGVPWMAFDTEFIPEKYYKYKLCLISAATDKGNYIIDVLKLKSIDPFLKMIKDPAVLKLTHAGENDYEILLEHYDVLPVNVFDTQLSYGFVQYDYPVGLMALVKKVLKKKIDKGQLRSDWERRPLTPPQCRYAIGDVVYLYPLMVKLKARLKRTKKLSWAEEENRRLEDPNYYSSDPLDFLNSGQLQQMTPQQKVFLLRMHLWRHLEAEKENRPVTQVLKTWVLNNIVQKIESDESALLKDRTLPTRFLRQHIDTFKRLYGEKIAQHELDLLKRVPEAASVSPETEVVTDLIHQLVKYIGLMKKISPKIIISGKEIQLMKTDRDYYPTTFTTGWRKELLGKDFSRLLKNRKYFNVKIKGNKAIMSVEKKPRFSLLKFLGFKKERDED